MLLRTQQYCGSTDTVKTLMEDCCRHRCCASDMPASPGGNLPCLMNLASYLKYLGTHLTSRAPLSTQLHWEGLSILGKHSHPDCVDQHRHHTQPLLLDGVEKDQVPGENEKRNHKQRMEEEWQREESVEMKDARGCRLYLGPAGSSSIRVR